MTGEIWRKHLICLDYFAKVRSQVNLPDSRGPFSSKLLLSPIATANAEVMHIMNGPSVINKLKSVGEKGPCNKYTPELKAKVAIYAVEHGNCQAARKHSTTDKVINCSTKGCNI